MFDTDTVDLIKNAPQFDGLDLDRLPEKLTDAYVSVVAARVRLRKVDGLKVMLSEMNEIASEMRKIAFANEALVSALPNRADKKAAAFVAGAAHHACLMANALTQEDKFVSQITHDSISPEVSATLLFMVAEATADSSEMAKQIVLPNDNSLEHLLLSSIVYLAKGKLQVIAEMVVPSFRFEVESQSHSSGFDGLLYRLLYGLRKLARDLLGIASHYSNDRSSAYADFLTIKSLCVDKLDVQLSEQSETLFSIYPGPFHLVSLLLSVTESLTPSAVINVAPPTAIDKDRWSILMRKIAQKRPFLWRNHRAAIASGYLESGISAAISFPTGAGKSTLSELKIATTLLLGKKVIFLVPTLALVEQTAAALRVTFPEATIQQERSDIVTIEQIFDELPAISVLTTERCLVLLGYEPETFSDVGLLVFDECHLLHSTSEETSHRPIDAMLCVLNFVAAAPKADLLLLSAMMQNTEEIAQWIASLTLRPCQALDLTWKPTRQARGCVVYESGAIETLNSLLSAEKLKSNTKNVPIAVTRKMTAKPMGLFSLKQTWISQARADYKLLPLLDFEIQLGTGKSFDGRKWYLTPNGNKLAGALARAAASQELKTLVFVQTIPLANSATSEVNDRPAVGSIYLTSNESSFLEEAIEELGSVNHSYSVVNADGTISATAVCHHGLLLPAERRLHESLYKRPDGPKVMIATSTLAQGMNLPSDVVIIGGDSRFDQGANKVQQLEAHELLNAAGRAGRAGESSYGFVLIVPSKIIYFKDGKNEIGRHWAELQTIFGQSDQCLSIEDPISSVLDEIQLAPELWPSSVKYFLSRLPVGGSDDKDSAARTLLQNSFVAFKKRSLNEETWLEERINMTLKARGKQSTSTTSWSEMLSSTTGVPIAFLEYLGDALHLIELPNNGTLDQWLEWYMQILRLKPHFLPHLLRPSTIEGALGKTYKNIEDDGDKGIYLLDYIELPLKQWISGKTFSQIELGLGTTEIKLGRCDTAREFVLRIIPELSFLFSLPAQVVRSMKKDIGITDKQLGTGLSLLSPCVRGGFDTVEKLALKYLIGEKSIRVSVHKKYSEIVHSIAVPSGSEDFADVIKRVKHALLESQ